MAHPKEGRAIFRYDCRIKDFVFAWGNNARSGAALIQYFATTKHMHFNYDTNEYPIPVKFEDNMIQTLEAAGYDTKTLKITIDKKY